MAQPRAAFQAQSNPETLAEPALAFLLDYWRAKRGSREMPARRDIRPAELKKYLDSIVMIDVLGGGDFRYRLVGTTITRYFLVDPTGKRVAEAWAPAGEDAVMRVTTNLSAVVAGRVPVRLWGQIDWTGIGEDFDALYLPFSDDGERVTLILNLFTFDRQRILTERQIALEAGRTSLVRE
ncbi:MAG: PAS domain-containing protein [Alphaproteobacteria bacterium]|nr:PAS domain-containing protein [Alphaproteobacteria bacterium]MBU6473110.1 PAS domain-containing protein [Alphaproteobacteria bacterium]MDE2012806.1 PAS domain-containing protein [Alphaproteobacteria bacterium]MDE2074018.1 PAS domain-containing protein [Alphaproteobacteria bacterium]MDE2352824.1 PAS domain-containing protein [Alphaproteobacteria bacterium]